MRRRNGRKHAGAARAPCGVRTQEGRSPWVSRPLTMKSLDAGRGSDEMVAKAAWISLGFSSRPDPENVPG